MEGSDRITPEWVAERLQDSREGLLNHYRTPPVLIVPLETVPAAEKALGLMADRTEENA